MAAPVKLPARLVAPGFREEGTPLPGVNVTSRRPQLRWVLPADADGAKIDFCRDVSCSTLVMTLEATGTRATPTVDLPFGLLFWRARWLSNGAPIVAAPTPTWRFRVPSRDSSIDRTAGTTIDVNGDGYADIIVGVSPQPGQLVRAYVYHGSAAGLPALPSGSLSGVQASATAYVSVVASLGDINGDGYTDVGVEYQTVTMPFGGDVAEYVSVYMGGPNGLSESPAITFLDPGNAIAAAGDVNGDGYSDFVVGGSGADVHLYLGSAAGAASLPSLTLSNPGSGSFFGWTAGAAGDVNGDGYGDVVIGAIGGLPRDNPGYVYLGGPGGLASTPAVQLFLVGDGDPIGLYYVTSFGDVNGDGFADLVVGVTGSGGLVGPSQQAPEKMAAVYLGTPNLFFGTGPDEPAVPAFSLVSNQNTVIDVEVSLANAGDVDGDGYDDIVVGGYQAASLAGQAYVYSGLAGSVGLSTSPSLVIPGPDGPGQFFGMVVAGPGDVNGDGYSDIVVSDEGHHVYVFEGGPTGISPTPAIILSAPDNATTIFGPNVAE